MPRQRAIHQKNKVIHMNYNHLQSRICIANACFQVYKEMYHDLLRAARMVFWIAGFTQSAML